MKLSLCITTYNRYEMTIESFAQVLNDDRIDDIVIMDDASTDGSAERLNMHFRNNEKVSVYQRDKNVGMSRNKHHAIAQAKNEWCIIFDSDNIIGPDYLDAFFSYIGGDHANKPYSLKNNTIFCPDFAKPQFDYTVYSQSGVPAFSRFNAGKYIINNDFNCLMNTCNYIVNRDFYLNTYQYNPDHKASDTIWHNYNHLKANGSFHVVPNMQYFHRVHSGSGFLENAKYNMSMADHVRKLIQQL